MGEMYELKITLSSTKLWVSVLYPKKKKMTDTYFGTENKAMPVNTPDYMVQKMLELIWGNFGLEFGNIWRCKAVQF